MGDYYPKKLATTLELVRSLGSGNQGGVLQYRDTRTGENFALKFEPTNTNSQSLLTECLLLRNNSERQYDRLPRYIKHDTSKGRRYLVMELLECTLEEHLEKFAHDKNA
jgi:hypothetical protein